MRRCVLALGFAGSLGLLSASAFAQAPRNFPANALRGDLTVTAPPEVVLNRLATRLSPGTRIRGANNLLVMSGAIVGQRLLVNYTRDLHGNVLDVWILTPEEANRLPWPTTPAEAAAWSFNPDLQLWTKP